MGIEDMPPEEAIQDHAPITLMAAAITRAAPGYEGDMFFSYAEFRKSLQEDRDLDVDIVAREAGYESGAAYLRHLGLNFIDDTENMVLPTVEGATAAPYIHGRQQEVRDRAERRRRYQQPFVPLVNYQPPPVPVEPRNDNIAPQPRNDNVAPQPRNDTVDFPPRPTPVIHIFDGDAGKVLPGMSFRIAGGSVYTFYPLPTFDAPFSKEKELLRKAGVKHRKKLREMVEQHKKMTAFYEKLRPVNEKKD